MDHDVVPHVQWRGPLRYVVCGPLGVAANVFAPPEDRADTQPCVRRGQAELDLIVDRLNKSLDQAHGTGQLAIAFGVPILQRKLAAKVASARGRPMPQVADPPPRMESPGQNPADDARGAVSISLDAELLTDAPAVDELAIPGYDTLSASQVVERLSGLDDVDRDAVRAYETAHRGRRTILGKLDQLQATG